MISVNNIHKSFGEHEILKGISFDISEGEIISIIGPSGSGKSTLLRCMNCLEIPQNGIIKFDDNEYNFKDINQKEISEIRKNSTMVFQNYNLFKHKTAIENIIEPLVIVKKMEKNEAEEIALDLLDKVGLKDQANKYPHKLSGGQQQRVGIARAMAMKPKVILLDEPTSSLDPELIKEVLFTIKKLAENKQTMIIVTHEMQFAKMISDKILFIDEGKIIEEGEPKEIFNNPKTERLKKFLSLVNYDMEKFGLENVNKI